MKKTEFSTPLIQSAAVLGGVLVLFAIVASSGANGSEGGVLSVIFGIGNLILFGIGMVIAVLFSIAVLIAIFLAAVAMVDTEQASQMYSDLKKNFALNAIAFSKQCSDNNSSAIGVTKEECDQMKQKIDQLQDENMVLQNNIKGLTEDNALLQGNVENLSAENLVVNSKIEELSVEVENLQASEKEIKDLIDAMAEKIQAGPDRDLKDQVKKLEQPLADTQSEISLLIERLNTLESGLKQVPTSGIFTYIETEEDQSLFIQKVEEALAQEMTYAQIDVYLTENLSADLDKIIKEHPALTKKYIRNLRKD
jgi:chromosome segregation ATPase